MRWERAGKDFVAINDQGHVCGFIREIEQVETELIPLLRSKEKIEQAIRDYAKRKRARA